MVIELLDRLADTLTERGWRCKACYADTPALRRVFHPALPEVGESVTVVPGPGSTIEAPVWWYRCPSRGLIAPCDDQNQAVAQIEELLWPCAAAAQRLAAAKQAGARDQYGRFQQVEGAARTTSGRPAAHRTC